jgi:hypothetical protein
MQINPFCASMGPQSGRILGEQNGGYFAATGPTAGELRVSASYRSVPGTAPVPGRIAPRCGSGTGIGRAAALPERGGDFGRIRPASGRGWEDGGMHAVDRVLDLMDRSSSASWSGAVMADDGRL